MHDASSHLLSKPTKTRPRWFAIIVLCICVILLLIGKKHVVDIGAWGVSEGEVSLSEAKAEFSEKAELSDDDVKITEEDLELAEMFREVFRNDIFEDAVGDSDVDHIHQVDADHDFSNPEEMKSLAEEILAQHFALHEQSSVPNAGYDSDVEFRVGGGECKMHNKCINFREQCETDPKAQALKCQFRDTPIKLCCCSLKAGKCEESYYNMAKTSVKKSASAVYQTMKSVGSSVVSAVQRTFIYFVGAIQKLLDSLSFATFSGVTVKVSQLTGMPVEVEILFEWNPQKWKDLEDMVQERLAALENVSFKEDKKKWIKKKWWQMVNKLMNIQKPFRCYLGMKMAEITMIIVFQPTTIPPIDIQNAYTTQHDESVKNDPSCQSYHEENGDLEDLPDDLHDGSLPVFHHGDHADLQQHSPP